MLVDSLMYFLYIVDKTSINYQSKTTMHFLTEVMHNSDFVEAVTVQSSGRGGGKKMQLVEIKCCLICLLTAGEKAER